MSIDLPHSRARRRTRLVLFAPAAVLFLVLALSAGGWLWARGRLVSEMDARAGALRQTGWTATWADRTISGFPFRMKVALTDLRLRAPGARGWGVSTPLLEAQAYVVEPLHWVFAAPRGLTVQRPLGGPLDVSGQALRASLAGIDKAPWRIALEGVDVRFMPQPGAQPFSFTSAKHVEAHLRPSSDGSGDGDTLVTLDGAHAAPESFLARLAPSAPITLAASGRLTRLSSARGADWSSAVAAWSAVGGAIRIDRLDGLSGPLHVEGKNALLGVDADGSLEGSLPLTPADATASALPIVFKAGRMTLGPLDVGPAPKLR